MQGETSPKAGRSKTLFEYYPDLPGVQQLTMPVFSIHKAVVGSVLFQQSCLLVQQISGIKQPCTRRTVLGADLNTQHHPEVSLTLN